MIETKIIFKDSDSQKCFLTKTKGYCGDIIIEYGASSYDGKSALSVMNLPKLIPLKTIFNIGENYKDLAVFRDWLYREV